MLNDSAIIGAGDGIFAVKGEADAAKWLAQWAPALDDQPFWVASGSSAMGRIMAIRPGLLPLYAMAKARRAPAPSPAAKAKAAGGVRTTGEGAVLATLTNPGEAEPFAAKRFDSAFKAEEWAARTLSVHGAPGATAIVADSRFRAPAKVITRDSAMARTGERPVSVRATEAPTDRSETPVAEDAYFVRLNAARTKTQVWQRDPKTDRVTFSHADRAQARRENARK